MFILLDKFVLSQPGELCQNEFTLLTKQQCKRALETIKKTYPEAKNCFLHEETHPNFPKGCFMYASDTYCVHWNPAELGEANDDAIQICSGKLYFSRLIFN